MLLNITRFWVIRFTETSIWCIRLQEDANSNLLSYRVNTLHSALHNIYKFIRSDKQEQYYITNEIGLGIIIVCSLLFTVEPDSITKLATCNRWSLFSLSQITNLFFYFDRVVCKLDLICTKMKGKDFQELLIISDTKSVNFTEKLNVVNESKIISITCPLNYTLYGMIQTNETELQQMIHFSKQILEASFQKISEILI